jgi:hypothetical protein
MVQHIACILTFQLPVCKCDISEVMLKHTTEEHPNTMKLTLIVCFSPSSKPNILLKYTFKILIFSLVK